MFVTNSRSGIARIGPIEWIPVDFFRQVMEVNFFGHVAVTAAFLCMSTISNNHKINRKSDDFFPPALLKKTQGRIINISSASGLLATPEFGPYSSSKFAMEAYSDSVRREMKKWKVDVVVVGNFQYTTSYNLI